MRTRLCLLFVLAACTSNPPTTNQQPPPTPLAHAEPAPAKIESAKSPPAPPPVPPPAIPPEQPPAATPPATYTAGPLATTTAPGGVLVVWSRHDGATNHSEILALLLDEQGAPRGQPKLVRRTSGEVADLALHRRDGAAWIAWLALLEPGQAEHRRSLVAAMRLEPDLSATTSPVTLHQFIATDPDLLDRDLVRVLTLASGDAVVATISTPTKCDDFVTGLKTSCPAHDIFWVHQDGTFKLADKLGVDGGEPAMANLVDTGAGVVFDIWAWRGGASYGQFYAPYDGTKTRAPFAMHFCRPPVDRHWTGSELVTLCHDDYADEGVTCTLDGVTSDEGSCTRVHTAIKGKRAVPLLSEKKRCEAGHPVLDLKWKGGGILLDPTAPGATIHQDLGVWTGKHAIKISATGARELWTCNDAGQLVPGPELADPLPLDPDPAALAAIPARKP